MQLGVIGLIRMGANIARRLMKHGHTCVVYDRDAQIRLALSGAGTVAALYARYRSRQEHTFAEKILSAMRKGFGGYAEPT
jgi:6-phosphogluconate dehydrogenase (decarboxylating)